MTSGEGIEKPIESVSVRFSPGQRVKYVANNRSFGAFIRSDQMRDVTEEVARDIAAVAAASIPAPSEDTDPNRVEAIYKVKRNAGLIKVSRSLRVRVLVEGTGEGAERAEFGGPREKRYRTLAEAGSRFGDWKPID